MRMQKLKEEYDEYGSMTGGSSIDKLDKKLDLLAEMIATNNVFYK